MADWRTRAKKVMTDKGITQEWLAERLEMTQGGVQHWLAGNRHPKLEDIDRIAAALGVPGYELTHGVTTADSVSDLPDPALSILRRLIAAQRDGQAGPGLWSALDQVATLALTTSASAGRSLGAPVAAEHRDALEQLSQQAEDAHAHAAKSQRRRAARR
jgi:transcriptional regulator with XRE-family HTH domain